jgi:CheY-like chemotaxis protein
MKSKKMSGDPIIIMLVEDNPDHAQLVLRNFKNFKIANKIVHLEDGEAAINYLKDSEHGNKPQIILLDLRLPKIDGLEVLKFIKDNPGLNNIPVVILTTSEAESDIARAYQYHANSYLVKPVDFHKFTELMSTLGYYWICWNKNPFQQ